MKRRVRRKATAAKRRPPTVSRRQQLLNEIDRLREDTVARVGVKGKRRIRVGGLDWQAAVKRCEELRKELK